MRVLALAILAVAPLAAHADKKSEADALFKKAKQLHADKRYPEACPMFEKTDALDPGIGAKLNTAKCYEDWGMLARAYRWYTDAYDMAVGERDDRAPKIKVLIDAIDADVPKLTIKLPAGASARGADFRLDGRPAEVAKLIRVDPGPHELVWNVDGERKTKTIAMERGAEHELTIDVRGRGEPGDRKGGAELADGTQRAAQVEASPTSPGRTRRIAGLSVGAAGLVGLGVATYLTLDARSTYKDALKTHCMDSTSLCDDAGLAITSDARGRANIATVVTVVSLAAIGGGVVLYLTAPRGGAGRERTALRVTPHVDAHGGGLVIGGGF